VSSNASQLAHLELECNNLGNKGVAKLLSSLFEQGHSKDFQGASLQSLGLACNNITSEGAAHLAAGLKQKHVLGKLEVLELGRNRLGPKGAGYLGEALTAAGLRLQRLGLCTTRLKDAGAIALAASLTARQGLRQACELCWPTLALGLRSNLLGDAAAVALADAVIAGELEELLLEFNKISGAGFDALEKALQHTCLPFKPSLGLEQNLSQFSAQLTVEEKAVNAEQGSAGYFKPATRKRCFEH
jgi:Ran GTPase-activating protein (RanGAP) involved in mRNA processing and transport